MLQKKNENFLKGTFSSNIEKIKAHWYGLWTKHVSGQGLQKTWTQGLHSKEHFEQIYQARPHLR